MSKRNPSNSIKNHLIYHFWVYILIAAVGWFVGDLLFTVTEYRPPAERKVEFQVVCGNYIEIEPLTENLAQPLLAVGQAFDETLEAVDFFPITYSGDASKDVYGAQKYSVMIAAQEGAIWLVNQLQFDQLTQMGALMPLETFVDEGLLHVDDLDLSNCYRPESDGATDEEGNPIPATGPDRLYGLPLNGLSMLQSINYPTEESFAVMMCYCANPETSAVVLDHFMDLANRPPEVADK